MARRNTRRSARAFLVPAPLIGAIVLAVTLALLYVWVDQAGVALGQQIRQLELKGSNLRDELVRESNKWTTLKSPENLERALLRHGVSMSLPRPEQIVRVGRGPTPPYRESDQYARLER